MSEYKGYKGKSLEFLKFHHIKVGDAVKIISDLTYDGILMPRYEGGDENRIVLKLKNGYNIGIEIKEISKIEKDQEKINRAENNFEEAGLRNLIEIKKGDALDIIKELNQEEKNLKKFDFVFIDADKEKYIQYFDNVFPLLKRGGLIGADNIIWPERFSGYIKPYLDHVKNHPKFLSTTIPIDNGEEISIKMED